MKKVIFLAGVAVGFLAGSRAGRGAYDTIEAKAREVASDPRVQETVGQARDTAVKTAQDAAATVKDKAPEVAAAAREKAGEATAAAKAKAGDAADAAKDKAGDATAKAEGATHRVGDDSTAPSADTDSRAATGGDASMGDRKLES